jgi:serine/threonine protein kinase
MFTEYMKGGELKAHLTKKKKPFTEPEAIKILKILIEAIEYIHSHNIVHRDIKLENILLNDSTNPYDLKIIDFGISGLYQDIGGESINAGTMAYSPPEVVSKANLTSSPKIDVWGLGVVLYLLLTKNFPFHGENDYITFQSIIKDDLKFPKSLPLSKQVRNLLH